MRRSAPSGRPRGRARRGHLPSQLPPPPPPPPPPENPPPPEKPPLLPALAGPISVRAILRIVGRPVTNIRHDIRNVAIIAHVHHPKTTPVDALLNHTPPFRHNHQASPTFT